MFITCAGLKVPETSSKAWKSIHQDGWSRTGQAEAVLEDGPSCPSHLVHSQWVFPPNLLPRTEAYDLVLFFVLRKIIFSAEDILGPEENWKVVLNVLSQWVIMGTLCSAKALPTLAHKYC